MMEEVFAIKVDPFSSARGVLKEGKCPDVIIVTGWWERPVGEDWKNWVAEHVTPALSRTGIVLYQRGNHEITIQP